MDVFIEPIEPVERLVVFGAGHVARPTAAFARELGFAVTVVDDREEWADASRFPGVELRCTDPRRFAADLQVDARTWILVTTHDHRLDQDLVEALLPRPWAWMGLIGSRAKAAKFLIRMRAAGLDPARFADLSTPVGLDIGAETPEEIAVSICAEIVRVRRRAPGAPSGSRPTQPLSRGRTSRSSR